MESIHLLDFSDEIFLDIFRHLNDMNLLNVAQVCKRFKKIAKDTIAKKYNGDTDEKYCEIQVYPGDELGTRDITYQFFELFGNEIKAIKVFFTIANGNNRLLKLINQQCRRAKYMEIWGEGTELPVTETIQGMSNLTHLTIDYVICTDLLWTEYRYPQLESLNLGFVSNIDIETLSIFLSLNPQLQHLQVDWCDKLNLQDIEELKSQFTELKSLQFDCKNKEIFHTCSDIVMKNLESLKITTDVSSTANVLSAIGRGSKMIQRLEVAGEDWSLDIDRTLFEFKSIILYNGLFDKLTELILYGFDVGIDLILFLVGTLPNLASLDLGGVHLRDITTDNVLNTFEKGKKLKELKLLRKDFNNIRPVHIFNSDFHRKFVDIVRDRGDGIKFELNQRTQSEADEIIITEDKITKNGEIRYWIGYETSDNCSNVQLFDLGEKVLSKICDYLDDQAQRALYETCTRIRNALQQQIKSSWFTACDEKTTKHLISRFGDHITKLEIDMKTKNAPQMTATWKLIAEHYSKNLVELSINNVRVDATGSVLMELPNLTKLIVKTVISSSTHIFPLMNCPKLVHLEFDKGKITLPKGGLQFGLTLTNLKTITVKDNVKNIIETFLHRLDDEICDQIEEFTVLRELEDKPNRLVHILARCRNLTTLNYVYFGSNTAYFEHLFKSCTKLKTLTMWIHPLDPDIWRRTLQAIKCNCKHLEVLKIAANDSGVFDNYAAFVPHAVELLPKVALKIICHETREFLMGTYMKCPKPF